MITRRLQSRLLELAGRHPAITLTGPRQSGKTTLCRMAFPDHAYVSLENPAQREFALEDPMSFLDRHSGGVVIDEIQRAPELTSYLQGLIDEDPRPGRFILTGSQNLAVIDAVSQSLAGRTALLELLPLDLEEIRRFDDPPRELWDILWNGGYPRIHERRLPAGEWLASYTATYVERDVRQIHNVGDLLLFQTFLRLCAGRSGQLLNLSSLASDAGISHTTARTWLSVLEASYIVFRLPPYFANLGKRLVKKPKLYFYDAGLMASLLGIEEPRQIETHPLRGEIFETWVVSEIVKQFRHRGRRPRFHFYRDRDRREIDLVLEKNGDLVLIEIKSGRTPSSSYFATFEKLIAEARDDATGERLRNAERVVIYGGEESQKRRSGRLLAWSEIELAIDETSTRI